MIANHIIIWKPRGDWSIFGKLAHTIFFHARAEIEALASDASLQPGAQLLFHPQPRTGAVTEAGFVPDEWTICEPSPTSGLTETDSLQEGDLLIEFRKDY